MFKFCYEFYFIFYILHKPNYLFMLDKPIVNIKQPCHENWNSMTPQGNGRFCKSCDKVVIDFTDKTLAEISEALLQHGAKPLCGNYNTSHVITDSKIDKFVWSLNTRGFKRLSLFILGVLIFTGCRTRHTRGMPVGYIENGRNLNDNPTIVNPKPKYTDADSLAK